ncbi:MAG: TIGR01906 family membrane protein [Chloroflexi bacterium]|nr:TIGR01906 family membrane protein [Chloroflexota bacterium]
MKFNINKLFSALIAILIPFIILMGGVRLIMTPNFPAFEYKRSGFPSDPYGFDRVEREKWSAFAVKYLTNDKGIEYLGNLQNFSGKKIFRTEELDHMADVKRVVKVSLFIWYVAGGLVFGLSIWLLAQKKWHDFRLAYRSGAWLTLALMVAMIVYLMINFNQLFDKFHRILFTEGSWLFFADDTLIRLFPLVFWRDVFLLVGLFTLFVAIFLLLVTRRWRKKPKTDLELTPQSNG